MAITEVSPASGEVPIQSSVKRTFTRLRRKYLKLRMNEDSGASWGGRICALKATGRSSAYAAHQVESSEECPISRETRLLAVLDCLE